MSAFYMQSAIACWKVVFAVAMLPFVHLISVPEEYVTGGKFESLGPALEQLFRHGDLVALVVVMMLSNGLHAIIGVSIIKEESAMQRQTVMMLVMPSVWIFFLLSDGRGHEEFSWVQLAGIAIVVIGTFWYIYADRDFADTSTRQAFLQQNSLKFQDEKEEGDLLLEEVDLLTASDDDDYGLHVQVTDQKKSPVEVN